MSEVDALAVLQGKVLCEDCFWFAKNAAKDETIKQRLDRQLKKEHLAEVPKYHFAKCIKRITLPQAIYTNKSNIPPEFPSPTKWRHCAWFITCSSVAQQGGGVACGLLWPIE